jgi:hypothetical protein
MKRFLFLIIAFAGAAFSVSGDPVVDGKVGAGEYAHSRSLMGDRVALSWQSGPERDRARG